MNSRDIKPAIFLLTILLIPTFCLSQTEQKEKKKNALFQSDLFPTPYEAYGELRFPKSRWGLFVGANSYDIGSLNYYKLNVFGTTIIKKAIARVEKSGEYNLPFGIMYSPSKGRMTYSLGFESSRFTSSENYHRTYSGNMDTVSFRIRRFVDNDVWALPVTASYNLIYDDASIVFFVIKAGLYPYILSEEVDDVEEFTFKNLEHIDIVSPFSVDTIINPKLVRLIRESTLPYRQILYVNVAAMAGLGVDIKLTKFAYLNLYYDFIFPLPFLAFRHTKFSEEATALWNEHYYSPRSGVQFSQSSFGVKLGVNLGAFRYTNKKDLFK